MGDANSRDHVAAADTQTEPSGANMCHMLILPAELLKAVAAREQRIALVVGAGCSLEHPTGLKLASVYAADTHSQLVRDGVLAEGECATPTDLSAVATAVKNKSGHQSALVSRLPHSEFRMAQPNTGYLIAAALLRERVLDVVLTLNFDLALSASLGRLSAFEVNVVPGPHAADQLASTAVIYLHRNVDEPDPERWILTAEALAREWQGGWEEVVGRRVMACPVVVFAGLGSPAAVLTATIARVRAPLKAGQHHVFVVDPAATTEFEAALHLEPAAHLQTGWCAFMEQIAARLLVEFSSELTAAGVNLCTEHGWSGEAEHLPELSDRLHASGLVPLGKLRARWLLEEEQYTPDDARKPLIADLLLGIGLIERAGGVKAIFREDGVVELLRNGSLASRVLPVSGKGTLRWSALESRVLLATSRAGKTEPPEYVIVSGVVGKPGSVAGPPEDVVMGAAGNDIIDGFVRPKFIAVDDIRSDPAAVSSLIA